jgi:hypothetical protein
MRIICMLFFLTLFGCNEQDCSHVAQQQESGAQASACSAPDDSETVTENSEPDEGVPSEAGLFETDVTFTNFDSAGEAKVKAALIHIKNIVRSKEFRERVLNYNYKGQRAFVDNGGKTNEEIYQSLLDASETLLPGIDHTMNLELELYYNRWTSTVGYTYPDTMKIWMNNKFFSGYTPAEVAGNIFHEWTHKLGYGHDFNYSESRDHSVPYALGNIVEELARN